MPAVAALAVLDKGRYLRGIFIYLMDAYLFNQRYEIGRELRRGQQGAVTYLITDRETKKAWAANIIERGLKVVPPKTHTHTHPQTQHTQVSHMMF